MPASRKPTKAFRKATKTAAKKLGRRIDAQIYNVDDNRRYTTTIGDHLRPYSGWITREVVEQHEALVAEVAEFGIVGNGNRHFGLDDNGHLIGNRYGSAQPSVADLNAGKKGDIQTLADILAWWSLRIYPYVESRKAAGCW